MTAQVHDKRWVMACVGRVPGEASGTAAAGPRRQTRCLVACLLACATALGACSGPSVDSLLADGKRLLDGNDRKGAELQLQNALKKQPENGEARFLLGRLRFEAWDFESAEKELRAAWQAGYEANQVAPLLARSLLEVGQPDKVLSDINPATLNDPAARALLDTYRARAQLAQGNVEEATAMSDAVLRASPQLAAAWVTQAQLLVYGKDLKKASQVLDGVLANHPDDVDALILQAKIAGAQRQYGVAQARRETAVAAAPAAAWPRIALISMLLAADRVDEVRQQVEILREVPGGAVEATMFDAQLALKDKNYQEARDAVAQVLKVVPNHLPALLVAGISELALGSLEAAETHLAKSLQLSPANPMARRLLAEARWKLGKLEAARAALEPVLLSGTADSLSFALAGQIEMERGEFGKARQLLRRAAEADPQDERIRAELAKSQILAGDVAGGIGTLRDMGASNSKQYMSDVMLVLTYLELGEADKALQAVSALEAKQPSKPLTSNLRGVALLRKRDYPAARQAFEAALSKDPQYVAAVMNLVDLDVGAGNMEGARQRLDALLARQPNNPDAMLALAELQARSGVSRAEVIKLVESAVAANPDVVLPRIALIRRYLAGGDTAKAVEVALAAKAKFPRDADILSLLGSAQLVSGDAQQAVSTLRELVALQERAPGAHFQLAAAQLQAGDFADARQSLKRTLQLDPQHVPARLAQIRLEARAGNSAAALDLAHGVQKSYPKLVDGYVAEGDLLMASKRYSQAAAAFRKGLAVNKSAPVAIKVHQAVAAGGNPADAVQFARTWLTDNPKDVSFREYLAERMIESRDYEGAKRELTAVIGLQPGNALALNNLAWVGRETKDPRALEYAEKAYELAPRDPRIIDTLGMIRLDRGELGPAADLLAKAVALAPKDPTIGFHYASALAKSGRKGDAVRTLEQVLGSGQRFVEEQEARRLLRSL
jgi:putative PEP-CTERM system TPR-repeat lipoprotein